MLREGICVSVVELIWQAINYSYCVTELFRCIKTLPHPRSLSLRAHLYPYLCDAQGETCLIGVA
jgi:hypothetical protein